MSATAPRNWHTWTDQRTHHDGDHAASTRRATTCRYGRMSSLCCRVLALRSS